ncbi:hypothetical protein EVAR_44702_1 [Eumeta japonica]|uniref:Uncharacterized protein n=1 Tax=Eumeta variegata TaxID=151549 RepID=A0A4C1XKP3_EUMVA|nr:hypothetical protein EVAR_44702_1 [Eumeta japonica]
MKTERGAESRGKTRTEIENGTGVNMGREKSIRIKSLVGYEMGTKAKIKSGNGVEKECEVGIRIEIVNEIAVKSEPAFRLTSIDTKDEGIHFVDDEGKSRHRLKAIRQILILSVSAGFTVSQSIKGAGHRDPLRRERSPKRNLKKHRHATVTVVAVVVAVVAVVVTVVAVIFGGSRAALGRCGGFESKPLDPKQLIKL